MVNHTFCFLKSFDNQFDGRSFGFISGLALERKDKNDSKRHTMSHPPDHIPELDSPRSRSPLKKDKKEQVSSSSSKSV